MVVGHTCDDKRLLDTGAVQITGNYQEAEAVELIRAQDAELGFLPALWPETWSYTLSQLWQAGLDVVAFDIGAPAERIARCAVAAFCRWGCHPPPPAGRCWHTGIGEAGRLSRCRSEPRLPWREIGRRSNRVNDVTLPLRVDTGRRPTRNETSALPHRLGRRRPAIHVS